MTPPRIAAFGIRSLPATEGCAGADKFADELLTRVAARGFQVTAYNRVYGKAKVAPSEWKGVRTISFRTVGWKGFDTLFHSARATADILLNNRADVVHIQNGGNSIWALILRLAGKKVFVSQDGLDWQRAKWPWYAKLFLMLSTLITAYAPTQVIFDNVFAKRWFERKFRKRYAFIPFGSEVTTEFAASDIHERLGLEEGSYFLFVGRFIPDKGLQYLVPAFEGTATDKKLVLVGGSPNRSSFEAEIRATRDPRILFPGYVYGADANALMHGAYAYVQPSDVEGLSPVILENMALGTPVICSDIEQNLYVVDDTATLFRQGDVEDLRRVLTWADGHPAELAERAERARERALEKFSWEAVTDQHVALFCGRPAGGEANAVER